MDKVVQSTSGECQVSDQTADGITEEPVTEPVNSERFAREGLSVLHHLTESSRVGIARAAGLIADCVRGDGVVHAFGTGHSQALVLELAGRAGGLVPTNRLSITDLVLYGGAPPSVLDDPLLEREPGVAARLYDLAVPRPQDLFVVISNSGVNNVIVEMALQAKEQGHRLLAITSLSHTHAVPAGHPSGKKPADLADVVLDNAAPRGDALLELPGGGAVCAQLVEPARSLRQETGVGETGARLLGRGGPVGEGRLQCGGGPVESAVLLVRRAEGGDQRGERGRLGGVEQRGVVVLGEYAQPLPRPGGCGRCPHRCPGPGEIADGGEEGGARGVRVRVPEGGGRHGVGVVRERPRTSSKGEVRRLPRTWMNESIEVC